VSVTFTLDGLEIQALNGGPEFTFTEAISLSVCAVGQDETDHLWGTAHQRRGAGAVRLA
jgi:predicted 3-demethylubiquinone-9 3-methyltransferase (glyoxalase superfamily)